MANGKEYYQFGLGGERVKNVTNFIKVKGISRINSILVPSSAELVSAFKLKGATSLFVYLEQI